MKTTVIMSDKSDLGDVGLFPSVYPGVKISLEAEPISERLKHVASPETALAATAAEQCAQILRQYSSLTIRQLVTAVESLQVHLHIAQSRRTRRPVLAEVLQAPFIADGVL